MSSPEEAAAALSVAELEAELIAAKEGDTDAEEYRDLKARLREARNIHRLLRSGVTPTGGDAAAEPDTVETKAEGQ